MAVKKLPPDEKHSVATNFWIQCPGVNAKHEPGIHYLRLYKKSRLWAHGCSGCGVLKIFLNTEVWTQCAYTTEDIQRGAAEHGILVKEVGDVLWLEKSPYAQNLKAVQPTPFQQVPQPIPHVPRAG